MTLPSFAQDPAPAEAEAMAAVCAALEPLRTDRSKSRVLRWAQERINLELRATQTGEMAIVRERGRGSYEIPTRLPSAKGCRGGHWPTRPSNDLPPVTGESDAAAAD